MPRPERCAAIVLRLLAALLTAASAAWTAALASPSADAVRFQNYDVEQGLSHGRVRAIAQDGRGYIWIATRDGLNRFDGHRFRIYRNDPADPHSLPDNVVMTLATLADGSLWIGTAGGGLARYDAELDRFERYRAGSATGLAGDYVRALHPTRDGQLWVGSFGLGLQRFDPRSGRAQDTVLGRVPELQRLHRIIDLPDGGLLFVAGINVFRWDGRGSALVPLLPAQRGDVQPSIEWALLDQAGQLWVGRLDGGLTRLQLDGKVLAEYRSGPAAALRSGDARGLLQTRSGEIWVGTSGGVAVYDAAADRFVEIRHDDADRYSPAAEIYVLFEDRDGLVWSGSSLQGIGVHDPASEAVALYRRRSAVPDSLPGNSVQAVLAAADGSLWLGLGRAGGLVHFRPGTGVLRHYLNDPADSRSLADDNVSTLALGRDGALWIGFDSHGLDRLDPGDGSFRHYRHRAGDAASLPGNLVNDLHVDADDTVWVGSDGGGLASLCRGCDGFRRYVGAADDRFDLSVATITAIAESDGGEIWFGLFGGGVARLDRHSGQVQRYSAASGAAGPRNDVVRMLSVARDGTLWIGGSGGLDKMVRSAGGQVQFQSQPWFAGEGSRSITCIAEDRTGQLWLGTADGLLRFDPAAAAPPQRIKLLNDIDRRGYANNACIADGDHLYFGGQAGLVAFAPTQLPRPAAVGPLVLNDLLLSNQPVRPRPGVDGAPLARTLGYSERLRLDYQHTVFGFDFAALDYRGPGGVHYRYRLEGLNDDWVPLLPDQHSVTFSGVPAGDYRFRVQAQREGNAPREIGIDLRIDPPPWRSRWAYVLYALALLLLIGGSMQRNRRRLGYARHVAATIQRSEEALRRLNDELEARVIQRTADLSRSNGELQATLDQLRLAQRQLVEAEKLASLGGLVAGISHEINTPLGVCLTAASHLQQESSRLRARMAEGSLRRSELERFQQAACEGSDLILRNLQRADRLVKSFKQTAVDQSTGEWRDLDLEQSVRDTLTMLGPVLRPTPHRILIECAEPVRLFSSAGALYQIVSNLVLNALQHAFAADRAGTLTLRIAASEDQAHLRVSDDGRGMNENERAHAFDPFFTTRRGAGGSGLGLHIVYTLVTQVLRGQIDCDSAAGAGTCFDIRWPLKRTAGEN